MKRAPNLREAPFTTANLADACMKLGIPFGASGRMRPLFAGRRIEGMARPVRHFGSVDVFLEAIDRSHPGEVLVVDNQGRLDEGCLGDLTVLEAAAAGLAGIVLWGCHRDTADLWNIRLPLFSLGQCPTGPRRLDARTSDTFDAASCDGALVTRSDMIVADDDGVISLGAADFPAAARHAEIIHDHEARQASCVAQGTSLRHQLDFEGYLRARERDSDLTFRQHLARTGGQIEV